MDGVNISLKHLSPCKLCYQTTTQSDSDHQHICAYIIPTYTKQHLALITVFAYVTQPKCYSEGVEHFCLELFDLSHVRSAFLNAIGTYFKGWGPAYNVTTVLKEGII